MTTPCFEGCACFSLVFVDGVDFVFEQQCKYNFKIRISPITHFAMYSRTISEKKNDVMFLARFYRLWLK